MIKEADNMFMDNPEKVYANVPRRLRHERGYGYGEEGFDEEYAMEKNYDGEDHYWDGYSWDDLEEFGFCSD